MTCSSTVLELAWEAAQQQLSAAHHALVDAQALGSRQAAYDSVLEAERHCTRLAHRCLASALQLEPVREPRMVLSLDVDGVLEDESAGFSATCLAGVAALRLLQLGGVAVILNTARSICEVQERVADFGLIGGVAGFGAVTWDGVFKRQEDFLCEPGRVELSRLRELFARDDSLVLDRDHPHCVRASWVLGGDLAPVPGATARSLLDDFSLQGLAFWVAARHTDFVDRRPDKAAGINSLQRALGLQDLPLAAIGDSACDIPIFRIASFACAPAATIPAYSPSRRQRFVRSRHTGAGALWDMACQLVPSAGLQRSVLDTVANVSLPTGLPESLRRRPIAQSGLRPRLAAAFALR